jgi:tRNA(Met) cytidine acetyltransferase
MIPRVLEKSFEEAKPLNERRLVVLSGKLRWKIDYLRSVIHSYLERSAKKKVRFVYITPHKESGFSKNVLKIVSTNKSISVEVVEFKDIDLLLGTNWDGMIVDLHEGIAPNDLGKAVGTVKGNGIIIFLMPYLEEFKEMFTRFHRIVIVPPYTKDQIRHVFNRWFIKKLMEHDGIFILEDDKIVKVSNPRKKRKKALKEISLPKEDEKNIRKMYKLCLTQDQVNVLKGMKDFIDKKDVNVFVLTSHRGRGKSSVIGLFLAYLVATRKIDVIVTSPERINTMELFRFLEIGLKKFGIKISAWEKVANKEDIFIKKTGSRIRYSPSFKVSKYRADLIVVDEAGQYLQIRSLMFSCWMLSRQTWKNMLMLKLIPESWSTRSTI